MWTIYCETLTLEGIEREPEESMDIKQIIYDFWSKVTPTILNMMSHSRVVSYLTSIIQYFSDLVFANRKN